MSIGFLLILDTSGWLECFHHQEDNSCSDECVKFNSNASKPTFTQVPRRQKLNCLTLLFLIGFGFQFLPFFSSLPVFPTKIGQEIIDSKVMGKLQKITQQRDYFKRFWPFSSQRSFKFPSLNFIMSCGLWLKKGGDQNWCHYRHQQSDDATQKMFVSMRSFFCNTLVKVQLLLMRQTVQVLNVSKINFSRHLAIACKKSR